MRDYKLGKNQNRAEGETICFKQILKKEKPGVNCGGSRGESSTREEIQKVVSRMHLHCAEIVTRLLSCSFCKLEIETFGGGVSASPGKFSGICRERGRKPPGKKSEGLLSRLRSDDSASSICD